MPPKKAPDPVEAVEKNFKLEIKATQAAGYEAETQIKVRLCSHWLPCSGFSPVFGTEDSLPWRESPSSESDGEGEQCPLTADFHHDFEVDLSDTEALEKFHNQPGVYAVIVHEKNASEEHGGGVTLVPLAFLYLDCSSLLMNIKTVSCAKKGIAGLDFQFKASVQIKDLVARPAIIGLEPLLIDINGVNAYPLMEDEITQDAANSVYMYGELKIGPSLVRKVLCFPKVVEETSGDLNETTDSDFKITAGEPQPGDLKCKFSIDFHTCLLPGFADIKVLKESLTWTTFVLEVHNENLFKRSFHTRNVEEYNALMATENAPNPATAAAPPAKGKKGAADPPPIAATSFGPITPADEFLLQCIQRALSVSRQIQPHGTVRFRMDDLLSNSNDLLTQFERRHKGGAREGDDDIVVEEEMLVEVRLEKPSKPDKWDLPADISLKGALQRAQAEKANRYGGTMAVGGTMGGTMGKMTGTIGMTGVTGMTGTMTTMKKKKGKKPPHHELFFACGTCVEMKASLYRKLVITDVVDPKSGERLKRDHEKSLKNDENMLIVGEEEAGSSLTDEALKEILMITPFTRMVLVFKYLDDHTLHAISHAMDKVNRKALPDMQGSTRSYSYNESELAAASKGSLDVISGFMIIDDDTRIVCIEGLAGPGQGMQSIFMDLPRVKENDDSLKILCNPEVLFPNRAYPEFGPDIRRIRVRDKLKKLARKPELYDRKQVEEICFMAVDGLMGLRSAKDIKSLKDLNMFPSSESLNTLELLYGEAISRPDMDGTKRQEFVDEHDREQQLSRQKQEMKAIAAGGISAGNDEAAAALQMLSHASLNPNVVARSSSRGSALGSNQAKDDMQTDPDPKEFKGSDCRNPEFEQYLRTRPQHRIDYLEENRQIRAQAWDRALRTRSERDNQLTKTMSKILALDNTAQSKYGGDEEPARDPKIYLYSTQTENYKTKAFAELRNRVAQDKTGTYTFSKDFVSQTVCAVDEVADKKKQAAKSKSEWTTPKGFVYPKPRKGKELTALPGKPSEARIEDLKEPYRDVIEQRMLEQKGTGGEGLSAQQLADNVYNTELERGYSTRFKTEGTFGSLNPPQYAREFELSKVGDRSQLPRGKMTDGGRLTKDPNAFRSVHLVGDAQRKIIEEAQAKEKEDWDKKVVVDHMDFKMCGFKVRDVPVRMNRANDILHGEPQKEALKYLRTRESHKGNDYSLKAAPLSIMGSEPFVSNAAANALVRQTDPSKFITARHNTMSLSDDIGAGTLGSSSTSNIGPPKDFIRYIHKDANSSRIMSVLAKTKIPPLDANSSEKTGPRWEPPSSMHK